MIWIEKVLAFFISFFTLWIPRPRTVAVQYFDGTCWDCHAERLDEVEFHYGACRFCSAEHGRLLPETMDDVRAGVRPRKLS